ncbi:hypothetical protein F5146DRAFT_372974 [Armillaria mellea]|nr:hypothetical protein F5146DRAFT_372974 [Armillaria mellea]
MDSFERMIRHFRKQRGAMGGHRGRLIVRRGPNTYGRVHIMLVACTSWQRMKSRARCLLSPAGTSTAILGRLIRSSHTTFILDGYPRRLARRVVDTAVPMGNLLPVPRSIPSTRTRESKSLPMLAEPNWPRRAADKGIVGEPSIRRLNHTKSFLYTRRAAALSPTVPLMSACDTAPYHIRVWHAQRAKVPNRRRAYVITSRKYTRSGARCHHPLP